MRWNSKKSQSFLIKNGVRQGAILSPSLFCVYLDSLFADLRNSGLGCSISNTYFGAFGYADDVILLAPTRESLQLMLAICEDYAEKHSMQFSTDVDPAKSKTKCMKFSRNPREIPCVYLNVNQLPWVSSAKHLGNLLSNKVRHGPVSCDSTPDLSQKKAIFFSKVHELIQCYGYCDPKLVVELINIFWRSFYGSPLWRLKSDEFGRLTRSWNTVVKMVWDLPYATHKRFVESLTVVPHLQSTLHSRYVGFMKNLQNSGKLQTTVMYNLCRNDLNSQTGQTIHLLLQSYEAEDIPYQYKR